MAQAIAGPILAVCANSPLLFGRRLWAETRIALFQQSLDTRVASPHLRELAPRVSFGDRWVDRSVIEIFQEDIVRFRVLMATDVEQDPLEELDAGRIPRLEALSLHNSTVYRWNRPCYGIMNGKPHLRIESRALPAGPSVVDEVANAVLWIGLLIGAVDEVDSLQDIMEFDDAKANFFTAARHGGNAVMKWIDGEHIKATDLVRKRLLPLAEKGLRSRGVEAHDIQRFLGVIDDRVGSGGDGSHWLVQSFNNMRRTGTPAERLAALTASTVKHQEQQVPGHQWELAELEEAGGWKQNYLHVEQYMDTVLFTVNEDELIDLVAFLMDRKNIRHVLVEDNEHRLVGLVSYRALIRLIAKGKGAEGTLGLPVKEIMACDVHTVSPETTTFEAIEMMRRERVSILPVVKNDILVGVVTEAHFMPIASRLLEEKLRETSERAGH